MLLSGNFPYSNVTCTLRHLMQLGVWCFICGFTVEVELAHMLERANTHCFLNIGFRDNKQLKQGHFEMGIRCANCMPISNRCARERATLCPLAKCYLKGEFNKFLWFKLQGNSQVNSHSIILFFLRFVFCVECTCCLGYNMANVNIVFIPVVESK